jgi:hypothetical protein
MDCGSARNDTLPVQAAFGAVPGAGSASDAASYMR